MTEATGSKMSRRDFLKGATGVIAGAALAGCATPDGVSPTLPKEEIQVVNISRREIVRSDRLNEKVSLKDDSSYEKMDDMPIRMELEYFFPKDGPKYCRFHVSLVGQKPLPLHDLMLFGYNDLGERIVYFGSTKYPLSGDIDPTMYFAYRVVELKIDHKRDSGGNPFSTSSIVRATPGFKNNKYQVKTQ